MQFILKVLGPVSVIVCLVASCAAPAAPSDDATGEGGAGGTDEPTGQGGAAGAPLVGGMGGEASPNAGGAAPDAAASGAGGAGGRSAPDAGRSAPDAAPVVAPVPTGRVPMFVAIGPGLRTTISCDDGRSWVENRLEKETDNDFSHDETNIHGAVFTNGRFYYPAGWGQTTTRVFASENGITWQRLYQGGAHQSNSMVATGDVLLFGEGSAIRRSDDGGQNWTPITLPDKIAHMRLAYGDVMGGRFVAGGRDGRHVFSGDRGRTWRKAQGQGGHYPVFGGGVFVSFQRIGGNLVRSVDGGATWQRVSCCGNPSYIAQVFWNGERFLLYRNDSVWGSADGEAWTKLGALKIGDLEVMARNPHSGNYVAARPGRPVRFYNSRDGINWSPVPDGSFDRRGDEIKYITFGYGLPSANCR